MLRGQGGVRDVLAALTMFEVAAEADVAAAQHALGMFYLQGYGVPKDTTKAFQYFKRAAGGRLLAIQIQSGHRSFVRRLGVSAGARGGDVARRSGRRIGTGVV